MAVTLDGFCRDRGAGPSEGCVLSVKPEQLMAFWGVWWGAEASTGRAWWLQQEPSRSRAPVCPAWWAPRCLAGTPPAVPRGQGWPGLTERARGEFTAWVQLPWVCSVPKNLLPRPTGNLCLFWWRWSASLQVSQCRALGRGAGWVRASGRFWCESRGAARAAWRSCSPRWSKLGLGGRHHT